MAQDYSGVSVFATRVLGVDILRAFGCGGGRTEAAESAERKGGGGGGSIDRRCWSCTCTSCIQGGAGSSSSSSLSCTDENCRCFPTRTRVHLRVFARVVFQGHPSFRPTSNESSRFIRQQLYCWRPTSVEVRREFRLTIERNSIERRTDICSTEILTSRPRRVTNSQNVSKPFLSRTRKLYSLVCSPFRESDIN